MMKTTAEWCPYCNKEVQLENKFVAQTCECGVEILPCAQCETMDCGNCPLKFRGAASLLEFYKERVIDETVKVFVYFNLHKKLFSVKALTGEHKGKVVSHTRELTLKDVSFRVREEGRQKVLREKRKNVHAGVVGYLDMTGEVTCTEEVTYNPYKYGSFVYKKDETKVTQARKAFLKDKKVFV